MGICQKQERHEILNDITCYPLSLLSKGEKVQVLPSMPKGEIVGNMDYSCNCIRGNMGSNMGLIRKSANNKFCELEFKNQQNLNKMSQPQWLNWHICHKKNSFFVLLFNISPRVFTQVSIERARWMWNLILHPTSTRTSYF